jgi:acetyl-CoA carboxylase biotin carboxylase subunit
MRKVLIANRGEIALRAVRAARQLGIRSVAVHSTADAAAPHVFAADEAVCIGPPPSSRSYLVAEALIHTANATGCDAVYPGYGFLSERASFAEACAKAGLTFIGPAPEVIALMGDKARAREAARRIGVPLVPGSTSATTNAGAAAEAARAIGYPLLLKARAGGGGKGMRIVTEAASFASQFHQAVREAEAAFGDGAIYLERFFPAVRHIEVQVFGDRHGTLRHLGERDCTIQRRHQKLVEEGPSPALPEATRAELHTVAEKLAASVGYAGAGTIEFIYEEAQDRFYFIEMNTRIQVEHPVTEALIGSDLVVEQLRVAAGERLSVRLPQAGAHGHAIEFRINAEDWQAGFAPRPGKLEAWRPPTGPGIRVDSFAYPGLDIVPFYDSMIAKLIVHAPTRTDALARARAAIGEFRIEGPPTTIDFARALVDDPDYKDGRVHTRWVEETFLPRQCA